MFIFSFFSAALPAFWLLFFLQICFAEWPLFWPQFIHTHIHMFIFCFVYFSGFRFGSVSVLCPGLCSGSKTVFKSVFWFGSFSGCDRCRFAVLIWRAASVLFLSLVPGSSLVPGCVFLSKRCLKRCRKNFAGNIYFNTHIHMFVLFPFLDLFSDLVPGLPAVIHLYYILKKLYASCNTFVIR